MLVVQVHEPTTVPVEEPTNTACSCEVIGLARRLSIGAIEAGVPFVLAVSVTSRRDCGVGTAHGGTFPDRFAESVEGAAAELVADGVLPRPGWPGSARRVAS